MNEALVELEQLPGHIPLVQFLTGLSAKLCGNFDEFYIYHWDDFNYKSRCFDYGELVTSR